MYIVNIMYGCELSDVICKLYILKIIKRITLDRYLKTHMVMFIEERRIKNGSKRNSTCLINSNHLSKLFL
jgi:hypothetical protein